MAHYKQRGKNSWLLVLEKGRDALGNRERPTKTIRIEDPAILRAPKRLDEYLRDQITLFKQEYDSVTHGPEERIGFIQLTEDWLRKHVDINLEEKTKENYRFHLSRRILPHFKHMWIDDILTRHISDYMLKLRSPEARLRGEGPLKSATIVYNYRVLKSIFRFAVEEQYLKDNPMKGIKKPKEDDVKEMEVYEEKEIEELIAALEEEPSHIRVMVLLAVTTGLRRGEIAGLEWPNIDLSAGYLDVKQSIPKTIDGIPVIKGPKNKNSIRRISLPEALVEELLVYKNEQSEEQAHLEETWEKREFVFAHPDGKPLHPKRLTTWWIDFHRRHNLKPIRLHDLRHTSISWMIFKNIHSQAIAKRSGHKNSKMMEIYGHIFKSVDRETAAAFNDVLKKAKSADSEVVSQLSPDCPPNSSNDSKTPPTVH